MKLSDYLDLNGMRASDFAREVGVASSTITRLLRAERGVTPTLALAVTRATGGAVRLADLLPEFVDAVAQELETKIISHEVGAPVLNGVAA